MVFTVLASNKNGCFTLNTATVGPLSCLIIDKTLPPDSDFNLFFKEGNKAVHTKDIEERERVFHNGGEVRYDREFKIYAAGMEVPGAKFSRAIGHKVGGLIGILPHITLTQKVYKSTDLMKTKILLLSSQLTYISSNPRFRKIFFNFKFAEEDLKTQVLAVMKGLEKNEYIHFSDYGLIYCYQN